jgi:hypothetical protein
MPTTLIIAAGAMGRVLVVLATVVVGIRQEAWGHELTRQPPSLLARLTRRLLGVYVRRPDPSAIPEKHRGESSPRALGSAHQPDGNSR